MTGSGGGGSRSGDSSSRSSGGGSGGSGGVWYPNTQVAPNISNFNLDIMFTLCACVCLLFVLEDA